MGRKEAASLMSDVKCQRCHMRSKMRFALTVMPVAPVLASKWLLWVNIWVGLDEAWTKAPVHTVAAHGGALLGFVVLSICLFPPLL